MIIPSAVIPACEALNRGKDNVAGIQVTDLALRALLAHTMQGGSTWIPARKIGVRQPRAAPE